MADKEKDVVEESDESSNDSNESSSDSSDKDKKKSKSSKKTKKSKKSKKDKKSKKHKKSDKKKVKKDKKSKSSNKDKKTKKTKGTKRGPKGAQWINWKIPYQESSILGQSFLLASKKGGIDIKKLGKQIKAWKGTPTFILRKLKKGHSKGFTWNVDDSNNRLRITNCKIADKKWKK